jgi:hypothetical protein
MIGGYLDESFDPSHKGVHKGIFAVGGILGRGRPIFELMRKWEELRKEIGIKYFKASECERGSGEFGKFVARPNQPELMTASERAGLDAIWSRFLDVMLGDSHEHVLVFGVGVVQDAFYEVITDRTAKAILGNDPYWFAYQSAMIQGAFTMKQLSQRGTVDAIAFVCDSHEKYSPLAKIAYDEIKTKNPKSAQYMGPFDSDDDMRCDPLQAADAAVYEIRRALNTYLGQWRGSSRWQFRKLADVHRVWLVQYADKRYLEDVVKENTPGQPLDLDHWLKQEFDKDVALL